MLFHWFIGFILFIFIVYLKNIYQIWELYIQDMDRVWKGMPIEVAMTLLYSYLFCFVARL